MGGWVGRWWVVVGVGGWGGVGEGVGDGSCVCVCAGGWVTGKSVGGGIGAGGSRRQARGGGVDVILIDHRWSLIDHHHNR